MPKLSGFVVRVAGLNLTVPRGCCRCNAPATAELTTTASVGGRKTRSFKLPYCAGCHGRAKTIQGIRTRLYLGAFALAALFSGFGTLVPWLPKPALVAVPCGLALLVAAILRQRAGATVDAPWGAWMTGGNGKETVFFCTHDQWAQAFAAGNGTAAAAGSITDVVRPWILALIVAGAASSYVAMAGKPYVHVHNAGRAPVQLWLDGKRSIVVPPDGRQAVEVPYGKHRFGWSAVGDTVPAEQTEPVKVEWMGDHLYNPGNTTCYFTDVGVYGDASGKGYEDGALPLQPFYTFKRVDTWFGDNPRSISTKGGGGVRVAVKELTLCRRLGEAGCPLPVRQALMSCLRAARGEPASDACVEQAKVGCRSR